MSAHEITFPDTPPKKRPVVKEKEITLWGDDSYKVGFNILTSELVYRIRIPAEKLREAGL